MRAPVALRRNDHAELAAIVRRNLEIKAEIVAQDEFERLDLRALLNFGHTVGHAIEQAAGYGHFLHGEAISLGMVAAAACPCAKPVCLRATGARCSGRCDASISHLTWPDALSTEAILASLARDKKFEAGQIRFVLAPRLGYAVVSSPGQITWEDIRQEVENLRHPA